MDMELKVFGDKATAKVFEQMPGAFQKRVLTTAARGGASVIRKAAQANLQANNSIRTGLLLRAIALRVKAYKNGVIWAGVGVDKGVSGRTDAGRNIVPGNYLHLVEFGTRHSRATPFLRPAADQSKAAVQDAVMKAAEKGLNREIKKLDKLTR
jgi:HK97 gp10 family phage protein